MFPPRLYRPVEQGQEPVCLSLPRRDVCRGWNSYHRALAARNGFAGNISSGRSAAGAIPIFPATRLRQGSHRLNPEFSGMQLEHQGESDATPRSATGFWGWLNHRTGLDDLLRTALYEPIPGGARF